MSSPPLSDNDVGAATPALWTKLAFPIVLIALGIAVTSNGTSLGLWARLGPGPGFFPLVLGCLLILLSLLWAVQDVRKHGRPEAESPIQEAGIEAELDIPEEPHKELKPKLMAAIVVSLVLLALLMPVLGFQLAMFFFLVFHLKILGKRRWLLTAIVSIVGSFGVFVLFTRVLAVNLPASSIGFLQAMGF